MSSDRRWEPHPSMPAAAFDGSPKSARKIARVLDCVGIATAVYLAVLVVMAIENGIGAA